MTLSCNNDGCSLTISPRWITLISLVDSEVPDVDLLRSSDHFGRTLGPLKIQKPNNDVCSKQMATKWITLISSVAPESPTQITLDSGASEDD
ncbi:unnamed protein product [Bursaphelenchus okinawaensis]|uniref:Uncharacterized protein n=1 Tax=Bursaphelenchus okinawaensis TaxID=465554 RepID=A0A811KTP8_9BILA|nr:unnamed protein product [Bursaphelenchus okinawaensis]CAG9110302.1 unnamed protein product [Bursaphelenchus okinawaensis]